MRMIRLPLPWRSLRVADFWMLLLMKKKSIPNINERPRVKLESLRPKPVGCFSQMGLHISNKLIGTYMVCICMKL